SGATASLGGAITLNAALTVNGSGQLTLSGAIGGTSGLSKSGGNTLVLSGSNSAFGGPINVSAGTLQAGSTSAFGSTTAITLSDGTTLDLNGLSNTIGSLHSTGAATAKVTTSAAATLTLGAGGDYDGKITGATGLTLNAGTLLLKGIDDYTGVTTLNGGTLSAGSVTALSNLSDMTLAGGSTLDLNGNSNAIRSLIGAGVVTSSSGTATLTVNEAAAGSTYAGQITGNLGLTKQGTGTLTLTDTSTTSNFTGAVNVNAGTLITRNLGAAGGNTLVAAGATLEIDTSVGNINLGSEAITLTSASGSPATLLISGGNNVATLAGPIILAGGGAQAGAITLSNASLDASTSTLDATTAGSEQLAVSGTGTFSIGNIGTGKALGGLALGATNTNFAGGTVRSNGLTTISGAAANTSGGTLTLAVDDLNLSGTLDVGTQALALTTQNRALSIGLGSGGALGLSQAEINNISHVTSLTIGDSAHTGSIVIGSDIDTSPTGAAIVTLTNSVGGIEFGANLTTSATILNVIANNDGTVNGSTTGAITASGSGSSNILGPANVNLTAASGIGAPGAPIKIGNTGVTTVSALDTKTGGIYIQTQGTLNSGGIVSTSTTPNTSTAGDINLSAVAGGITFNSAGINAGIENIVLNAAGAVTQANPGSTGLVTTGSLQVKTFNDANTSAIDLSNNGAGGNDVGGGVRLETHQATDPTALSGASITYNSVGGTVLNGLGTTGAVNLTGASFDFISNQPLIGGVVTVTSTSGSIVIDADIPNGTINLGQAGGSLTLNSATSITINGQIGGSATQPTAGVVSADAFNHPLTLIAATDINVNKSMYLTGALNFNAGGAVNIKNQAGATTPLVINASSISFGSAAAKVQSVNIAAATGASVANRDLSVRIQATGAIDIYTSGNFTLAGGGASASGAVAAAALGGGSINVNVGGNFTMTGGTASNGGIASVLVQATASKTVVVGDSLIIKGGSVSGSGGASATFDPSGPLSIVAGHNVVLQAGSGPNAGANLVNQGAINIEVNTAGAIGYTYGAGSYAGLVLIGAAGNNGSGLYNNDPILGQTAYHLADGGIPPPITLNDPAAFFVVPDNTLGNAIVLANVPQPVNPDLAQQILATNLTTQVTGLDNKKKLQDDGCN
ncbi:MAG TPA: autotransporter-associated beta strand repeat-containing protein, partial [Burkholderiales bacterium]